MPPRCQLGLRWLLLPKLHVPCQRYTSNRWAQLCATLLLPRRDAMLWVLPLQVFPFPATCQISLYQENGKENEPDDEKLPGEWMVVTSEQLHTWEYDQPHQKAP